MAIRFAFDLGTGSIGWAVFKNDGLANRELLGCGVRIFPDGREASAEGRTGDSRAKKRRAARGPRRRRDRFVQRRSYLLALLRENDLLPRTNDSDFGSIDPYEVRAKALKEKVPLHHLGRALYHLNQRRGFKSNRLADTEDNETAKIASASAALALRLKDGGFETLGVYYWHRLKNSQSVRVRMDNEAYEYYPQRAMLEKEFDILWERQKGQHEAFPDGKAREQIRDAIFSQRPLRPVPVGRCTFYPEEDRLARYRPETQERLILEKVNNIRIERWPGHPEPLIPDERSKIFEHLMSGRDMTFKQFRAKLELPSDMRINLEEGGEKLLNGNSLVKVLIGISAKKPGPFRDIWDTWNAAQQLQVLEQMATQSDPGALTRWFKEDMSLDEDRARHASRTRLPQGYGSIGLTATQNLLPHLRDGLVYSDAMSAAGLHHSDRRDGEFFRFLPKYNRIPELAPHLGYASGDEDDPDDIRYGKVANPSVHVGLNQLRRVINALIKEYGRPDEIVLELARDLKQTPAQKEEMAKRNRENRTANDNRRKDLLEGGHIQEGDRKIREHLIRMRLWEELGPAGDRRCPYSGKPISLSQLNSDLVEIEHILPRSRTLDDSLANKTVAYRDMNRLKRNLSPAEFADQNAAKIDKAAMQARAASYPANKRWRFMDDAMERFEDENSFLDRQLNETRHLSRLAKHYVSKLKPADPERQFMNVWVVTGQLTAELRRKWEVHLPGHNQKSRDDHRHHALDASVIGMIDRALIQKLATAAAVDERDASLKDVLRTIEEPYRGYTDQVNAALAKVIVSHRPNHRKAGQLHEDTSYGPIKAHPDNVGRGEPAIGHVVRRKPIVSLTEKEVSQVRDLDLRAELEQVLYETKETYTAAKDFKKQWPLALQAFVNEKAFDPESPLSRDQQHERIGHYFDIKKARVLKAEADTVTLQNRQTGKPYRKVVPGDNHHMDIIELPGGKWIGVAVSTFDANQPDTPDMPWKTEHPDARFIMRLHKTDTVQRFDKDWVKNEIKRVVRLVPSNQQLFLADHYGTGNLQKRHADTDDPFRWDIAGIGKLKERRARRVRVDEVGRVHTVPHGIT